MNCVLYDDLADVISDSMDEIGVYDNNEDDDDIGGGGAVILTLFVDDDFGFWVASALNVSIPYKKKKRPGQLSEKPDDVLVELKRKSNDDG